MNVLRFSDLIAAGQVAGRRVFIRADLNVPLDEAGRITEDTRIRASLPSIKYCLKASSSPRIRWRRWRSAWVSCSAAPT